ncbi:LysE family transporter [Azospirillum sp. RWY-5-1]|uniref:LysE family transporter n=1 Tax=Azospirillum oleiclasticum TaxID=2735135 RepID=A0ABX2T499_9PROT|nr:LysE family transporter [Azospirillum oleiclasticum]NYZ11961.1 LysE family transporter [Azospirillum oleiclasticum]NYZ19121.1 LysE family transporter [Azospirillum oleiclasticum]
MPVELWLAFAAAAAALILIPGPTVLLVIGYAVSGGLRPALAGLIGVALGDATAIAVSFLGMGAVLATSAELFLIMKWAGAAYLVWLGLKLWRAPPALPGGDPVAPRQPSLTMLRTAFMVTVLNPKGILFFTAFMPQFIDPAAPALPQMMILGGTFVALALSIVTGFAVMGARARHLFRSPAAMRTFNRVGGGVLIGAGALTATLKRV